MSSWLTRDDDIVLRSMQSQQPVKNNKKQNEIWPVIPTVFAVPFNGRKFAATFYLLRFTAVRVISPLSSPRSDVFRIDFPMKQWQAGPRRRIIFFLPEMMFVKERASRTNQKRIINLVLVSWCNAPSWLRFHDGDSSQFNV